MGPARVSDRQAYAAALAPGLLVLVGGAIVGALDVPWAVVVVALLVAGAWWSLKRLPSPAAPGDAIAATPAPGLPQDIIEAFPEPIALIDGARKIVGLNRAARNLVGMARPGRDLALSLRHPAILSAVDRAFSGVAFVNEEIVLPVPVPRTFTLHASRLPSTSESTPDPARPAVLLMLRDETRAKRAEQSRADFVANASHELRSPLAALLGIIETLRGPAKGDPEAQARFLDIMRVEAQRMARLIEDLLSLSRVEINEHVPPRGRVKICEILDAVEATLAVRAHDHGMRIGIDCPEDLPPVIGDADQLTQVFHNLVDNAVKYGGDNTSIQVSVRAVDTLPSAAGGGLEIRVEDHGPGIPDVHLPRVTERFYRVDAGRSRKLGGTGLGLAIAKHIVSRHRGHMRIESAEGRGTTVVVLLPTKPV